MGIAINGNFASEYRSELLEKREDPSGTLQVAIAEGLLAAGETSAAMDIIEKTLANSDGYVKLRALNLIETLDESLISRSLAVRLSY